MHETSSYRVLERNSGSPVQPLPSSEKQGDLRPAERAIAQRGQRDQQQQQARPSRHQSQPPRCLVLSVGSGWRLDSLANWCYTAARPTAQMRAKHSWLSALARRLSLSWSLHLPARHLRRRRHPSQRRARTSCGGAWFRLGCGLRGC